MAIDIVPPVSNISAVKPISPLQNTQFNDALQSLQKFSLVEAQERIVASADLNQVNSFFATQLDMVTQSHVCVVPYWTNEEEVRRKASRRIGQTRNTKSRRIQGKDVVIIEIGFTSRMLTFFLKSHSEQQDIMRRVQRFAHILQDNDQQGGVYFLDETQAVVWTHQHPGDETAPVRVQWMHPHALSVLDVKPTAAEPTVASPNAAQPAAMMTPVDETAAPAPKAAVQPAAAVPHAAQAAAVAPGAATTPSASFQSVGTHSANPRPSADASPAFSRSIRLRPPIPMIRPSASDTLRQSVDTIRFRTPGSDAPRKGFFRGYEE